MQTVKMELPTHWIAALEYGPEGMEGFDASETIQFERFVADMVQEYGACWPIDYGDDEGNFRRYHDATAYGVLACNVVTVTFDISAKEEC